MGQRKGSGYHGDVCILRWSFVWWHAYAPRLLANTSPLRQYKQQSERYPILRLIDALLARYRDGMSGKGSCDIATTLTCRSSTIIARFEARFSFAFHRILRWRERSTKPYGCFLDITRTYDGVEHWCGRSGTTPSPPEGTLEAY